MARVSKVRMAKTLAKSISIHSILREIVSYEQQMELDLAAEKSRDMGVHEIVVLDGAQHFILDGVLAILSDAQDKRTTALKKERKDMDNGDVLEHYTMGDVLIINHSRMSRVVIELPRALFYKYAGVDTPRQKRDVWNALRNGILRTEAGVSYNGINLCNDITYDEDGNSTSKPDAVFGVFRWIYADMSNTTYKQYAQAMNLRNAGINASEGSVVDRIQLYIDRNYMETMMKFIEGEKIDGHGYLTIQSQLRKHLLERLPPAERRQRIPLVSVSVRDTARCYTLHATGCSQTIYPSV